MSACRLVMIFVAGLGMDFGPAGAWELEVSRATTRVEVVDPASAAPILRLELQAELDRIPAVARQDVVATWKQAGGVSPIPFIVTIPAECFAPRRTGFDVEDFRACGVSMAFGPEPVPLIDFEARLILLGDGTALLDLGALFSGTPDDSAPELLGALGGAVVELAIGAASSAVPPLGVETVSGVEPTPFLGISRATTELDVVDPASAAPILRLEFQAELDRIPAVAGVDVVASWQQAGGVQPTPFIVTIPGECFVPGRTGFHVENFRACGVSLLIGRQLVPLVDFDARLVIRSDGTALLDLGALFGTPPDDGAPELLGALGGAVAELAIGAAGSALPPLAVGTVSGVDPIPF